MDIEMRKIQKMEVLSKFKFKFIIRFSSELNVTGSTNNNWNKDDIMGSH